MAVTMREVAAVAGVSVATVSRVLAGEPPVAESKRRAVQDACVALGYRVDALAAALRTRSSGSVGMLIPDISAPFFPAVVQTVEHELAKSGTDLLFCDASNDVETELARVETLLRRRVDALLVCPVDSQASRPALRTAARYAHLLQFERHAIEDADYVGVDQRAGMARVVDHLKSLGVTEAVFIGRQDRISSIAERAAAFEALCAERGVEAAPTVALPKPDVDAGRAFVERLLEARKLPPAIVCANDEVAFGTLLALKAAGVRWPTDVVVIGHDDVPAAAMLGLTSVQQPLRELGQEAAKMLQQPSTAVRQVLLAPTLVVRGTTVPQGADELVLELVTAPKQS